ncbi:MAG TPA: group-specific protein [Clostridia bacterium]|nr:group-specific protein [Clostridia bacterium]
MRFYVASGLENQERVRLVIERICTRGHTMAYDWTTHGDVRCKGEEVLITIAGNETFAVIDASFVLILLPGGRGTHTELGLALASRSNKRIVLWSETGEEFGSNEKTCAFYHHSAVERLHCGFDELLAFIDAI